MNWIIELFTHTRTTRDNKYGQMNQIMLNNYVNEYQQTVDFSFYIIVHLISLMHRVKDNSYVYIILETIDRRMHT